MAKCEELKLPPAERVDFLASLLDAAQPTPELLTLYDSVAQKLTARVPIAQLSHRKQFIEYKLKLAQKNGSDGQSSSAEKADLIAELTEVKNNLEKLTRNYERTFHESYAASIVPSVSSSSYAATHTAGMNSFNNNNNNASPLDLTPSARRSNNNNGMFSPN